MKNTLTLTTALFFLASLGAFSQTIYIAPDGTGDGTSWAEATGDLIGVLAAAAPNTEIWAKEGIYRPATCSDCTFNDRNQRIQIPDGVRLFGSFAGDETEISQRDIAAHPSVFSGDIDGDGTLANNSFTILYTHNVSPLTVIDGFTVSGGNADQNTAGLGTPQSSGAGWFNLGSTSVGSSRPLIRNCRFEGNHAWGNGGAMYNDGSFNGIADPVFEGCIFSENTSRFDGGTIYSTGSFEGQANPEFVNCVFENNESFEGNGGGIFSVGAEMGKASPVLTGCTFFGNVAALDGGCMYNFGFKGTSSPIVTDCLFEQNAAHAGGAVYNDGTFGGYSAAVFSTCVFRGNVAVDSDGGAIYNSGYQGVSSPELSDCIFENNNSAFAGGAIFNNGSEGVSSPIVSSCRFIANVSDTYGGAIYNQGSTGHSSPAIKNCLFEGNSGLSAGAIYNLGANDGNANATITNCTFFGNHANVGGAVYCNAGENGTGTSSPAIRNCIFWENTASDIGDVFRIIWGTPTISHSLVDKPDCDALYNGNGGHLTCDGGLVFGEDPLFTDPASGNFHLLDNSPAIDDGDNQAATEAGIVIDLDHLPRIHNGTVDFGVFEFGSSVGTAPVVTQNPISQTVCEADEVVFFVSATGGQPLEYQWFKNGIEVTGANQGTFVILSASQNDGAEYTCEVTSSTGETTLSEAALLTVNAPAEVLLTVMASQTEICEGEEITLTAVAENEGFFPEYQWYLNGNAFGGNIATFNIDALNDGDVFHCEITSSAGCILSPFATSNDVAISVETSLEAAVNISADVTLPCDGQAVILTADPMNGGSSPTYQWSVNNSPVGGDSSTYSYAPQNGDEVLCEMTSSKDCVVTNPVGSNVLILETEENLNLAVEISASADSTICLGDEVIFSAVTEHAGTSPSYEWKVNGETTGPNEAQFATDLLNDLDLITCEVTSSLACVETNPILSNEITVSMDSCLVAVNRLNDEKPTLETYPNPTSGNIFVKVSGTSATFTAHLLNAHGQHLLPEMVEHPTAPFVREFNLTHLPKGVYYFQIVTDKYLMVEKIVVE